MAEYVLQARGLSKEFEDETVFEGIDLDIERREVVALMGPNGVGKTILLCCLAGGLPSTDGDISVMGEPPGGTGTSNLNLLLQDSMGIDRLTGRENIRFYSRLHDCWTGEWRSLLDELELGDVLDREFRDFSGGMKRKLELAITLSVDTPLYLLDEPTAGLDLSSIRTFHDIILQKREEGKTFVFTSHTPLDGDIADRILFLNGGKIVAAGAPDELLGELPSILRVRGSIGRLDADLSPFLVDDQLFERGDEARGFLRSDVDLADVEETLATTGGTYHCNTEPPSYVDLFNYHTTTAAGDEDGG